MIFQPVQTFRSLECLRPRLGPLDSVGDDNRVAIRSKNFVSKGRNFWFSRLVSGSPLIEKSGTSIGKRSQGTSRSKTMRFVVLNARINTCDIKASVVKNVSWALQSANQSCAPK